MRNDKTLDTGRLDKQAIDYVQRRWRAGQLNDDIGITSERARDGEGGEDRFAARVGRGSARRPFESTGTPGPEDRAVIRRGEGVDRNEDWERGQTDRAPRTPPRRVRDSEGQRRPIRERWAVRQSRVLCSRGTRRKIVVTTGGLVVDGRYWLRRVSRRAEGACCNKRFNVDDKLRPQKRREKRERERHREIRSIVCCC